MKQIIFESLRVVESLLLWSAALPAAVIAFPGLILTEKAKRLVDRAATHGPSKNLTPRMA